MFLEVENDENMLKARTLDGVLGRYKKSDVGTAENVLKSETI